MMNRTQLMKIFQEEAILFGNADGIPEARAIEIFGEEAVLFAKRTGQGNFSGYGYGTYTAGFLTLSGALAAASYNNVTALERM